MIVLENRAIDSPCGRAKNYLKRGGRLAPIEAEDSFQYILVAEGGGSYIEVPRCAENLQAIPSIADVLDNEAAIRRNGGLIARQVYTVPQCMDIDSCFTERP